MVSSTRRDLLLRSANPTMIQSVDWAQIDLRRSVSSRKGRFEGNSTS